MNAVKPPAVRFVGWILLGIYIVLGGIGLALQFVSGSVPYGVGQPTVGWLNYASFGVWAFIGALLITKQPNNPVSYCYSLAPLCMVLVEYSYGLLYFGSDTRSEPLLGSRFAVFWLASSAYLAGAYVLELLMVLFPSGRPSSQGWTVMISSAGLALLVYAIAGILSPDHLINPISSFWVDAPPFNPNPFDLSVDALAVIGLIRWVAYGFVIVTVFLSVGQLLIRLHKAHGVVRQQLKWIVFASGFLVLGLVLVIVGITSPSTWAPRLQRIGSITLSIGVAGVAVASGIAILRYRLFDIDFLIRRTTQYAIVTGLMVLLYFSTIVILQRLFTTLTGQSSSIVVVLSTLLIAVLFLPVRRRVQSIIDRRFFRRKYDAEKVLTAFAATVRDETDLDALTAELVRVIQDTMQPEFVSVWLNSADRVELQAGGASEKNVETRPIL